MILAGNGLFIVLFEMVLVYKLENKKSVFLYISIGSFLIGLSFFALEIAPLFVVAIFSMLLLTLGEMFLFPFMNNFWVSRSSELTRGQYAALYNICFAIGNVVAPTLSALIITQFGFNLLWTVDFVVCLCAALGFLTMRNKFNL
ncbi:MAG: hypothetical protein NVS1B13_23970 [Flavisolibacter sp.]